MSNNRLRLLYICSSQFSGSTLTSFLLNQHKDIATIGHTTGWRYTDDEDFRCSCGAKIRECRLFSEVESRFMENQLPFDPRDFGTAFQLVGDDGLNRLLTAWIPGMRSSRVERWRDALVGLVPAFHRRLATQRAANLVLMRTVLDLLGASVYLDNSQSPFRLRYLSQSPDFDIYPIHLIRDPRGVSLSMMTNSGLSAEDAVESWLRHQLSVFRIAREIREPLMLSYENLCTATDEQLSRVHRFVGLNPETFSGDFKSREHHILGNRMRLASGTIKLDERWRRDLAVPQLRVIEDRLERFIEQSPNHPLSLIVSEYLGKTDSSKA